MTLRYAIKRTYVLDAVDYEILLNGAPVGTVYYDPHAREQVIRCCSVAFPRLDMMPDAFRGRRETRVPALGDVYRFFGLPLPSAQAVTDAARAA